MLAVSAVFLPIVLALMACAPETLRTELTTFGAVSDLRPGESVAVVPATNMDGDSVEVQLYLDKFADQLRQNGLTVVAPDDQPELIASLDIRIDEGRQILTTTQTPVWGQVGTRTEHLFNSTPATSGQKFTVTTTAVVVPVIGIVGHSTSINASTVYTRDLRMRLSRQNDDGSSTPVYEARLRSRGACSDLPALIDPLLGALLNRFPNGSGTTLESEISLPKGHPCRN
ncbi:MAG: hypothetical protein AB7O63_06400 [Reyranellaceae bacterium]